MHSRDRIPVSADLPSPAPLPSLTTAFSRRAALFGAVTATGFLAAAAASALGKGYTAQHTPSVDPADARLAVLAEQMIRMQALSDAHQGDDDEFSKIVDHLDALSVEMDRTSAGTFAGVLHKLRVIDLPGVGDDGNAHDIMVSICDDISRLHASGALS